MALFRLLLRTPVGAMRRLLVLAITVFAAQARRPPSRKAVDTEGPENLFKVEFSAFGGDVGDMRSLAFSPNGTLALSGHWNHTAKLWSAKTGKERLTFWGHTGAVLAVAWCADGERVLTGSADGTARLWAAASGEELKTFQTGSWAATVACGPQAATALAGSNMDAARLFDADTNASVRTFDKEGILTVAYSHDGSKVLTANRQNEAVLWETETGKPLRVLEGHKGWIVAAAFSPEDDLVATGAHDSKVQIWRVATGGKVRKLGKHQGGITALAFSEDGQLVATGSQDMTARVWHVASGRQLQLFNRTGAISGVHITMESVGGSTKYKTMVGWLRRADPKPKRNDREQCERDCAAAEEEERRSKMPIFEL
eukprot:TRINITY_DN28714_c0_g1_i1.p1 TRINITY_DN28714_c0_g1~~TRINITY_DN28714_c0_g1_i1.p1  ORF type:complete len:392 (-),score=74.39 TRINITY_DN28714_c0_g1_i1:995-2104(-)